MDIEIGSCWSSSKRKESWKSVLLLAYQSLGVVYGDLSISPLYVYKSTFAEDIKHTDTNEEIFGVLSFVFWTLTLIPLFKYVFIVLRADDNGEGGTFALYSLICRHVKVSLLPNKQAVDEEVSTYKVEHPLEANRNSRIKDILERHKKLHTALLLLVLLGTCMVIGDGILTPAISVFSAVSGLELSMSKEHHEYAVVPITCVIILGLFALQHYGTHKVGFIFAPVILIWLLCISALGLYNIFQWNPSVYQALSPYYMYKFLRKTKKGGWMSLGGILLCITGSEAMFADLGHFSYTAIQIAFTFMVYPALILAYMGQAAYLSKHHHNYTSYQIGFYVSVPETVRWPVLIVAIFASVVGSQAIISGTFSIISQSQALCCFPRVKVVHTSDHIHGQIYIPEINWMLMVLCVAVAVGFRDTKHMGNASGLAVMTVMLVTTCLTTLVMIVCWNKPPALAMTFFLFFFAVEALYFSASLTKFMEGAWLPILLALFLMLLMYSWHYSTLLKHQYDVDNKLSLDWLLALGPALGVVRVPGIGLVHSDVIPGVPANFSRFVTNLPAFHQVLVLVCVKSVPVPRVPAAERYLLGRLGPADHRSYRCIVRYGYREVHQDLHSFESELVARLADFIVLDGKRLTHEDHCSPSCDQDDDGPPLAVIGAGGGSCQFEVEDMSFATAESWEVMMEQTRGRGYKRVRFAVQADEDEDHAGSRRVQVMKELDELWEAEKVGTAFIMGSSQVKTKHGSGLGKKVAVDVVYEFLRRNCRGPEVALKVPAASLLEVGMVYLV